MEYVIIDLNEDEIIHWFDNENEAYAFIDSASCEGKDVSDWFIFKSFNM